MNFPGQFPNDDPLESSDTLTGYSMTEEMYRSVFANMLNGFAFCRMLYENEHPADILIINVNNAFTTLTGLRDVCGKTASTIIPGIRESDPEFFDIFDKVARTGNPQKFEKHLNAAKQWLSISAYSPEHEHFVVVFDVITERKRYEEALRHKTALFEAQVNTSIDGIMVVDTMGQKIIQNERLIDMWKIPEHLRETATEERIKHLFSMVKDPEDFGKTTGYIYSHPEITTRDEFELRDGTVIDRYTAPVIGTEGQIYGRTWNFRDITDRKRAEELVAAEKELLSVTLMSIGDGVITTDTNGCIVIMNKVAEELTGWKKDEASGKPLSEIFVIIDETSRLHCEDPVKKVLEAGQIIELENNTILVARDGSERAIADSVAPIRNSQNETIGVVLVFHDVTEKRKMIDTIQRIDKLDSIGLLAGGIAHDFNNILGALFGYLELAHGRGSADPTITKYLSKALSVFKRAKDLTQQLLTFSKGGAPQKKTGKIGAFIQENATFVLSGSNVGCSFLFDSELWPCDYDESQIGQVIDNIVINAQQAMPRGGLVVISARNVTIDTGEHPALREGNYVKISIADSGEGIPPELQKRIFDPFFSTKPKGNGLGLATSYSIIQKHDGFIDVESEPGKGSTFHIFLPASKNVVPEIDRIEEPRHHGSGTILIMDDEENIRDIVCEMLCEMGYSVVQAKNGQEALALCAQSQKSGTPFCCAFFDLTIPGGMGGKDAIVELRKFMPDLPVFASSGFSEGMVMANPEEYGFTGCIPKPFHMYELGALLQTHLGGTGR
jgi:PAS domain S-box-containing protein